MFAPHSLPPSSAALNRLRPSVGSARHRRCAPRAAAAPALASPLLLADAVTALPVAAAEATNDMVTAALFTAAIAGLVVVTGGVIYLTYADFQDRQAEAAAVEEAARDAARLRTLPQQKGSGLPKQGPGDPRLSKDKGFGKRE